MQFGCGLELDCRTRIFSLPPGRTLAAVPPRLAATARQAIRPVALLGVYG